MAAAVLRTFVFNCMFSAVFARRSLDHSLFTISNSSSGEVVSASMHPKFALSTLLLAASEHMASLAFQRTPASWVSLPRVSRLRENRMQTPEFKEEMETARSASMEGLSTDTETKAPDLNEMTFEERLEYLAANVVVPDAAELEKREQEEKAALDNIVIPQFWTGTFWQECLQDLQEAQYPSRKQVIQNLVISQVAFLVLAVVSFAFDLVTETGVRTLLQKKDWGTTWSEVLQGRLSDPRKK